MRIDSHANLPARHKQAVMFCCDENYLPYALFSAAQIAALHPARDFDICICHTAPLDIPESLAHLGVRVCVVDAAGLFDGFGLDARRTAATYLRLALPQAFEAVYDRILYLDSDIDVQSGDISSLLSVDLGPHPAGAVRDNIQWRTPGRMPPEFRTLGLKNAPYFNAGVMLIDTPAWQAQGILEKSLAFGAAHAGKMLRNDQTLLNCVLHRNWAELSPLWNWQYSYTTRLLAAMTDPHITHFIGPRKPWADIQGQLPPRYAHQLGQFLAQHFPDRPAIAQSAGPLAQASFMRRMFWRNWLASGPMRRYLAGFETDLTTRKPE